MTATILIFSFVLLQTIPGIPPVLVSGNNARPIIEVTNSIWRTSGLLFLLLTVVGIWMSQFKMISEKTGGPGQYMARALTVGLTLGGYKIIFALIMWTGALIAFQIFPIQPNPTKNTVIPWLPAGTMNSNQATSPSPTPGTNTDTNSTGGTRPPFQITKGTSVIDMIFWGLKNGYQLSFQAVPAMIIIALCNILFVLALFIITAFWITFAVILYALGPLMIMAGLIPTYGDKLWGNWIGATIQCSLWQVWMAFCAKLITSSFLIQIEQLNPMNRVDGNSGGGELSTAVMDMQQASYAVVFLVLYIATPFIANYVFPLGSSAGLGSFMLATAAAAGKKVASIKTGGTSEVISTGSKGSKQSSGSKNVSGTSTTATKDTSSMSNGSGNKTTTQNQNGKTGDKNVSVIQSNTAVNNTSYDGSNRDNTKTVSRDNQSSVGTGNDETQQRTVAVNDSSAVLNGSTNNENGSSKSTSRSNDTSTGNSGNRSSSNANTTGTENRQTGSENVKNNNEYSTSQLGNNNYGAENGNFNSNSTSASDIQENTGSNQNGNTVYVASSEKPKDVRFGKLPTQKTSNVIKHENSTAENEAE